MSIEAYNVSSEQTADRTIASRDPAVAEARCLAFAVMSDLMASPHDVESTIHTSDQVIDFGSLPYDVPGLQELIADFRATPVDDLKRAYSSMFEVGSDGPPVPVREDLQLGQKAGVREELVRFYEYFGYTLGEKFAWAPDHLSVELEFMHYLTYGEALAVSEDGGDPVSFQLAQADFIERHLVNWVPKLQHEVQAQGPDSLYCRVVSTLNSFLTADYQWQSGTISYSGVAS